jgi:protein phosphatase
MNVRLQESEFISCAGETIKGSARPTDQDRLAVWGPEVPISSKSEKGYLFAVADGMGGHKAGEHAAEIAIESLLNFYKNPRSLPESIEKEILTLAEEANSRIFQESKEDPPKRGMGSTLSGALVKEDIVFCFHVGDSRIYTIDGSNISQVTLDHADHEGRLTNHLGFSNELKLQTEHLRTEELDYLIICTDGVWRPITQPEIMMVIDDAVRPDRIVARLLTLAENRGGFDNATAICIQLM